MSPWRDRFYRRPRLGLALSGGGARGLAHIGVLKVLEQAGITADLVVGTSMGGVIAAAYASGMTVAEIEREALESSRPRRLVRLIDPAPSTGGLIGGQRIQEYFERLVGRRTFADMRLPLAMVAVDLNTRREVVLREGPVAEALRATTAVPGVFAPLEKDGMRLVDGGVLNNLPVDVARKMGAEVVIAVDISPTRESEYSRWFDSRRWVPKGLLATLQVLEETISTLMIAAQEHKLREFPPDILIRPDLPREVTVFTGFERAAELIAIGEEAARHHLEEIQALLVRRWRWPTAHKEQDVPAAVQVPEHSL